MWELLIIYDLYRHVYNNKAWKISKMKIVLVIFIILILTISIFNYLIFKGRKDSYLEAGKKWDGIVKELRKRK